MRTIYYYKELYIFQHDFPSGHRDTAAKRHDYNNIIIYSKLYDAYYVQ